MYVNNTLWILKYIALYVINEVTVYYSTKIWSCLLEDQNHGMAHNAIQPTPQIMVDKLSFLWSKDKSRHKQLVGGSTQELWWTINLTGCSNIIYCAKKFLVDLD